MKSGHERSRLPVVKVRRALGARWTLSGDGTIQRRLTVRCEPHGETRYAEECASCPSFVELRRPGERWGAGLLCAREDPAEVWGGEVPSADSMVARMMQRNVLCVRDDVPAASVAALMVACDLGGVPVVDGDGRPLGVVSRRDLLRARCLTEGPPALSDGAEGLAARLREELDPTRTARDVMSPLRFTLYESTPVTGATDLMVRAGDHRLVVVALDGAVIGLVSAFDVARWLSRQGAAPAPRLPFRRSAPAAVAP